MAEPTHTTQAQSDWDLKRPRLPEPREGEDAEEALTTRLEQRLVALEARMASAPHRWWESTKVVTFIASLVAALVPVTTVINGYLQRNSDLQLAAQQQRHTMRMDYLQTALNPTAPEIQRQSRLRLLVAILEAGDPLRLWAEQELVRVEDSVRELKQGLKVASSELAQLEQKEQQTKAQLEAAKAATPTRPAPPDSARPTAPGEAPRPTPNAATIESMQARLQQTQRLKAETEAKLASKAHKLTGDAKPLEALEY